MIKIISGQIQKDFRKLADFNRAKILQRFFKTGRGEYGEGDKFIGITVPQIRLVAKKYVDLSIREIENILHSEIHEERLLALLILIQKFSRVAEPEREKIHRFYLKNLKWINNWDLVDLSAPQIVGAFLSGQKDRRELYRLAKSKHLWSRRVAIIATFTFIKQQQFDDSLKLAENLLFDKQDLIQKAVGWMLREVGKRDLVAEENFLKKYAKQMPRITLRYAIEKFPPIKRNFYLKFGKS